MRTNATKEDVSKMSVEEVLSTFTDRGEPKFTNIIVEQNYSTQTTKIWFETFGVTMSGNDKMFSGPLTGDITFLSDTHNGCFLGDSDEVCETVIESDDYDITFIMAELSEGFEGTKRFIVSVSTAREINRVFGIYTFASSGVKAL